MTYTSRIRDSKSVVIEYLCTGKEINGPNFFTASS